MMLLPYAVAASMAMVQPGARPAPRPATAASAAIPVHEVVPASFTATPGTAVTLTLRDQDREVAAWPEVRWMLVRVAASQRNYDDAPQDARASASVTIDTPGTGIIGVDFEPRQHQTTLTDLRAFIAERGRVADPAAIQGEGAIAIQRVQSTKTIITCGRPEQAAGASESISKSGQQVEFRPFMDPTTTPIGGDIAVRTYINGAGLGGARVLATHIPSGKVQEFTCDSSGIGHFTLDQAGRWRVELHDLRRKDDRSPWTLYSATLTFDAPGVKP
jgi:hypothetical protein